MGVSQASQQMKAVERLCVGLAFFCLALSSAEHDSEVQACGGPSPPGTVVTTPTPTPTPTPATSAATSAFNSVAGTAEQRVLTPTPTPTPANTADSIPTCPAGYHQVSGEQEGCSVQDTSKWIKMCKNHLGVIKMYVALNGKNTESNGPTSIVPTVCQCSSDQVSIGNEFEMANSAKCHITCLSVTRDAMVPATVNDKTVWVPSRSKVQKISACKQPSTGKSTCANRKLVTDCRVAKCKSGNFDSYGRCQSSDGSQNFDPNSHKLLDFWEFPGEDGKGGSKVECGTLASRYSAMMA